MTKYLFLLIMIFQLHVLAENIQGQEIPNNAEFFQDENLWRNYYVDNLKRLDRALNRKNIVFDLCPSKKLPDNSNDQTNIIDALSQYMSNFQFFKFNTDIFYSKNDRFQCDMDVTVILPGYFSESKQNNLKNPIYWTKEIIAQRWKIASSALAKCKIKIKNLTLTSFEVHKNFRSGEPSFNPVKSAKLLRPFQDNDRIQGISSVKYVYAKELASVSESIYRGHAKYWSALALGTEITTPGYMSEIWISNDDMYLPIIPKGLENKNPKDPGSVNELHELYHVLTTEDNDQGHFHNRLEDPNEYNPMSDLWMRKSGTFTEDQCKKMREIGQQRDILRCSGQ